MNRLKTIEHYRSLINSGDIELIKVRQELEAQGVDEEEIRIVVRLLDNEIHRTLRLKRNNAQVLPLACAGLVITTTGLVVMAGSYTGLIPMGNYFLVPYGAILGGISITLAALAKRR